MRILFVSGSIGLGHVVRDLAIARELRKCIPGVEIRWLAAHPATAAIQEAGEELLPESEDFRSYTAAAEKMAGTEFQLNILKYGFERRGPAREEYEAHPARACPATRMIWSLATRPTRSWRP